MDEIFFYSKSIKVWGCFLFLVLASIPGQSNELFPEDGSQAFRRWFYQNSQEESVLSAFKKNGVEPIQIKIGNSKNHYNYLQDLFLFDSFGNLVVMAPIPPDNRYFTDVTDGVFESYGYFGELTRINIDDSLVQTYFRESKWQLNWGFYEGGGLISGRFEGGSPYIILSYPRFLSLKLFYEDTEGLISKSDFIGVLAKELKVPPKNFILLDSPAIGTEHLDLYMKALPKGIILLDDPKAIEGNLNIIPDPTKRSFYINPDKKLERERYQKSIDAVSEILNSHGIQVVSIPGRVKESRISREGNTFYEERLNFFNGISGVNQSLKKFFITNKAHEYKLLESLWLESLAKFGYEEQDIYFVGQYFQGAGLDCYGVPAP